jgi:hypothetical protein
MVYRSKLMPPREVLVWLYVSRRLSDEQIGELCDGVSPNTVANWRRRLDIHRQREALPPDLQGGAGGPVRRPGPDDQAGR